MNSGFFKWNVVLTSILIASVPVSVNAQVIYGLNNARHFNTHQSGPYFVQVGSFHSARLADQLKNELASRTHYPVQVRLSGQYHVVRIGPLSSIAEVRSLETGQPTARIVKPTPKHINTPITRLSHSPHMPATTHQPTIATDRSHNWYVGMNAGLMQTSMSKSVMTVPNNSGFTPPQHVDHYSLEKHQPAMIDVQAGRRWNRNQQWLPTYALALRYQHVFTKNIQGTVTEFSLPEFINYDYHWGVGADALSLYSKIDLVQYRRLMPYVDMGIGFASMQSKHYSETALSNVTPRLSPDYASKRNSQFTYNLGAGLDFILTQKLLLSAGYEYQSFGKLSSGIGQGADWHSAKLNLGKFNTNMGLVGLTYLFDGSMHENNQSYK
jgi:opacity protein-like surface antigen